MTIPLGQGWQNLGGVTGELHVFQHALLPWLSIMANITWLRTRLDHRTANYDLVALNGGTNNLLRSQQDL